MEHIKSYVSTVIYVRKLILSMCVHLIALVSAYHHAWMVLPIARQFAQCPLSNTSIFIFIYYNIFKFHAPRRLIYLVILQTHTEILTRTLRLRQGKKASKIIISLLIDVILFCLRLILCTDTSIYHHMLRFSSFFVLLIFRQRESR